MYFLEEIGKFKKFLIYQYQIFLLRQFITDFFKIIVDGVDKLIQSKSGSKEELELNLKGILQKANNHYHHNIIQIFGLSRTKNSYYNYNNISTSNLDLNKSDLFMKKIEEDNSEEFRNYELLTNYLYLNVQDAKNFLESFNYLEMMEKSPEKLSKITDKLFFHTQRAIEILGKIGHANNERIRIYSKEVYLKLIGLLLQEYEKNESCEGIIKLIHQKLETSLKKNPVETFRLFKLFFEQKSKFRNLREIMRLDRHFSYFAFEISPDLKNKASELSSQIQKEIYEATNKVETFADISNAIERIFYEEKNPYQLLIGLFDENILQKVIEIIKLGDMQSEIVPDEKRKDINHILKLFLNLYEGEYRHLLGWLICLEEIIQKGTFDEVHILNEDYASTREVKLIKFNPLNRIFLIFNKLDTKLRHAEAHNKISYDNGYDKVYIRGESLIVEKSELERKVREKAKIILACFSFIDFFEIFISNFYSKIREDDY